MSEDKSLEEQLQNAFDRFVESSRKMLEQWIESRVNKLPLTAFAVTGTHLGGYRGITDNDIPILASFSRVQNITTCTIILWPDEVVDIRIDFSGIAVLNPADEQDNQDYANRLAFKRAARKAQEHFTIGKLVVVRARDLYSWYRFQLRADGGRKDESTF